VLGHSHATSGALAWVCLATTVPPALLDVQLEPRDVIVGAAVCAGAALLPDLDHHDSTVANFLGPPSELAARIVGWAAGGHRRGTHSFLFVALAGAAALLGESLWGRPFVLGVVFAMLALALQGLRLCPPGPGLRAWGSIALQAGIGTWVVARYLPGVPGWLPYAVALGCLAHIAGDCLTDRGCPLFWPSRRRYALPIIDSTGNNVETMVLVPAMTVATVLVFWVTTVAPVGVAPQAPPTEPQAPPKPTSTVEAGDPVR
jgi:membrane-bound metal-dependent hydrolase YbcI (DUF457 family)